MYNYKKDRRKKKVNYKKNEIKEGINLHVIETNKFKTNLLSVFLTTPLKKDTVTKEALIASVLRRGTKQMPSTEEISINLEEMYGASFDCGVEKIGENHITKFYLETINDEFLPEKDDILKKGLNTLFEIIFNPLIEEEKFKEEYVKIEKENLKQIINGKRDNKAKFALERTIEEMYKNRPYGLYKFGYIEDLEKLTAKELYTYYKEMIKNSKIDIFVSGKIDTSKTKQIIEQNENIKTLQQRTVNLAKEQQLQPLAQPQTIQEPMDVTQGKLVLGLTIQNTNPDSKYTALLYNAILGGGANSKLFQNVREKASLAYTAGSNYIRQMNNIFIRCGIEIQNYQKALDIIKKQLQDIQNGNFTDQDIQNAKQSIIQAIKFIPDEQDTRNNLLLWTRNIRQLRTIRPIRRKIKAITKDQIIDLSKQINIHTIYFLTNQN